MNLKKNIFVGILAVLSTISMSSCSKTFSKGTIDRDCTGTYLTFNNKDYFVCNPSIISSFQEGDEVHVKYKSKSDCPQDPNQSICELYHQNYGIVEVLEIK